jgi:hypothetical protein
MDSEQLAGMFDYIQAERLNLHSLVVIGNGYVVAEAYFHPHKQFTRRWCNRPAA